MEDETQFVPFVIHIATSDAAWLAAWAPDPRALGAHAMGLAALRGLLAEDMPKGGQPLGGEIQHARALIENARAERMIGETAGEYVARRANEIRASDLDGSEMFAKPRHDAASRIAALESRCALLENDAKSAAGRIAALEERNAGPRMALLEERLAVMGNRLDGHDTLIRVVETAQDIQRNRIAALEAKS